MKKKVLPQEYIPTDIYHKFFRKRNNIFCSILLLLLFPVLTFSQSVATKVSAGYGLYKDQIHWISWDLNNNGADADQLISAATTPIVRTYTASSGLVYTITLSNVKVYRGSTLNLSTGIVANGTEVTSGSNHVFYSKSTTDYSGNNFQFAYGGGTTPAAWTNGNIIGLGNYLFSGEGSDNMITFRLTIQVNYPGGGGLYGGDGNSRGIVMAGTESLCDQLEWEQYSIPSGKLQIIDKYIANTTNDCSAFNLKLFQNSTTNPTRILLTKNTATAYDNGKGDVMVMASNTPYVDCMVKGHSGQHLAIGFIDNPNLSQAPDSYGEAIHIRGSQFGGGIISSTPYTFNTQNNTTSTELATYTKSLHLGAEYAIHTNYLPAAAGADPVTHNNGDHYADGLVAKNTFDNKYSITYTNNTTSPAYLTLWIDKNRDGVFDNVTEVLPVKTIAASTAGTADLDVSSLNLPVAANYYARFRISSQSGLTPSGFAPDGEVEDYWLSLSSVVTESGTVFTTGGTAIANVTSNDLVNGAVVVLGSGGNATISQSGTWPTGITLNTNTGAVNVAAGTTPGAYLITYQLCDNLSPQSCETVTDQVTVYADSDGDGVSDYLDLDDDNDGILDIDENCSGFLVQNTSGAWKGKTTSNLTATLTGATAQTNTHTFSDGQIRYYVNQNGGDPIYYKSGNINFTYTFSTPVPANEIAFFIDDLDPSLGSGSAIITFSVNGGQPGGNFILTDYGATPYLTFNNISGVITPTGTADDQRLIIKGIGNTLVSSITITSTGISSDGIAYALFANNPCDTDGDGIPNYFDLDSDGDGCPDAIEGAGVYTASQLTTASGTLTTQTPNQNFGTAVDANGIPTTVGATGQGIGESQDPAKKDCLDSDNDGVPDWQDLDDDNDGILDTSECTPSNNVFFTYFNGGNYNPTVYSAENIASASASTAGVGLTRTLTTPYNYMELTAINATNEAQAITNNEYVEYSFTTNTKSAFITQLRYYLTSNTIDNTQYSYTARISDDNFATNTLIGDTKAYMPPASASSYITYDTYQYPYWLKANTAYKIRIYFFNVGGGSAGTIAHDDFTIMGYTECDFDNDGIPNRIDLDSDGDGCVDAIEGDGTYTASQLTTASGTLTTQTPNQNFGVAVNATTGIPTAVGAGQGVGQSQDATKSDCMDSDGDGYPDWQDLDDDNDGILDTDEYPCTLPKTGTWTAAGTSASATAGSVGVTFDVTNAANTSISYTPTGTFNTTNFWSDATMAGANSLDYLYTWDTSPEAYMNRASDDAGTATFTITFSKPVLNPIIHIDRLGGLTSTVIGTTTYFYSNSSEFTLTTSGIIMQKLAGNSQFVVSGNKFYRQPDVYLGTTNPGIDANSTTGTAAGSIQFVGSVTTLTFTVTGVGPEGTGQDGIEMIFQACPILDTDNDGTPDYLDLDSDGDGCPDALEGDENVTSSQINANGSINIASYGGVDANGVPNLVNNGGAADVDHLQGQGVGTSQNSAVSYCKNYWIGTTSSTAWNTTTNWTGNFVPIPGENVEFATATNNNGNPAVNDLYVPAATEKIIGKLINLSDKATVIPAGSGLIVNDTITGSDTDASKLQIQAASDGTTPNGSLILAGQPCAFTVMGTVQMYAKGIKGSPIDWTDNNTTSPTYGLHFITTYQWQQFGVPVKSVVANPTFYGSYLREYSEETNDTTTVQSNGKVGSYYNKWITLNNASNLTEFKGYEITQDAAKTITMQGALSFCDKTITLTRSAASVPGSTDGNINNSRYGLGQNIFGNSFTAAIDVSTLTFPANVEQTVYLYNTGSFGDWTGHYTQTFDNTTTTAGAYRAIPYNVAAVVGNEIPSMQGFLLKHTGTIGTTIDMTLPYNKLIKNTKPQSVSGRNRAAKADLSYLEIELNSKSTNDKLWLFSQEGTSDNFDNGWDGRKFLGTPTAFIYAPTPDGNMQVNTTNNLLEKYIDFVANGDTQYALTLKKVNIDNTYSNLYLVDYVAQTITPIDRDIVTYQFTANNDGTDVERFQIKGSVHANNEDTASMMLGATVADGKILMTNNSQGVASMQLFDVSGKMIVNKTVQPMVTETLSTKLIKGFYLVKMTAGKYNNTMKVIIK